jgi:hypothetical protein
VRILIEEPSDTKSKAESELPILITPYTEIPEPRRQKDRSESVLPSKTKSKTESELPSRLVP